MVLLCSFFPVFLYMYEVYMFAGVASESARSARGDADRAHWYGYFTLGYLKNSSKER